MTRELIDREENLNIYIYIYIENSKYFNTHTHKGERGEGFNETNSGVYPTWPNLNILVGENKTRNEKVSEIY